MKIGVDAGCLSISDSRLKVGVYYVVLNLLKELSKIDKKNTYLLYSFKPISREVLNKLGKNMKNTVALPARGWMYFGLPFAFIKDKPDIFLAINQAMPRYHPFKTIGMIHGLDFKPEFHKFGNSLEKLKKNTKYLVENSDYLITTSEFLKQNLEREYNVKNVTVANLGVSKNFFQKTKRFKLDHPYFLFVGSFKPSKNIPTILKAFYYFLEKTKLSYYFLLIGSNEWLDSEIEKTIPDFKLNNKVIFKNAVANEELPAYYSGATAFVSPSLYEGFGMPYIEAMASGCPVIVGDKSSEAEVVGDTGILVDPNDYKAIGDAMIKISKDNNLRNGLVAKGKEKAKNFAWDKFAGKVFDLYYIKKLVRKHEA